jgi:hypothetical protein
MSGVFDSAEELEGELLPALRTFLASPAGEQAQAAVKEFAPGSVFALQITDPELDVWVDFASLEAGEGPREDASGRLLIDGDALHHLGMDQLSPAQVARAVEERRIDAKGSFELMLILLESLDPLGAVWRETLAAHGREDLLELPAPEATPIYTIEETPTRQGHVPEWSAKARRAVSKSTRRND